MFALAVGADMQNGLNVWILLPGQIIPSGDFSQPARIFVLGWWYCIMYINTKKNLLKCIAGLKEYVFFMFYSILRYFYSYWV